jgi:hypothetical protein
MDQLATTVIERTGRALGAAAYCKNERLARLITDLQVYVRQNHAERDLLRIGEIVLGDGTAPAWAL